MHKRPKALLAIVAYKLFSAALLAVTAIALFLTLENYQQLAAFADEYVLTGKRELIKLLLEKFFSFNPKTLEFAAIAASAYSALTLVEAVGLWYEKTWAKILVLVLVGVSIPPEIYEIIVKVTLVKFTVFVINLLIFYYLLKHTLPEIKKSSQ